MRRTVSTPTFPWLLRRLPIAHCSRLSAAVGGQPLHTQQISYPLPWPQSIQPNTDSLTHKLAGLLLLKQFVSFSLSEFILGVKDAVNTVAEVIGNKSRHSELEQLLLRQLSASIKHSLYHLPPDSTIHLDVETPKHLQLCTVRGIVGEATPDDAFAIKILGQEIVSSERNLQMYSEALFRGTKEERIAASNAVVALKANFELGVSFMMRERFVVYDKHGEVIQGSNNYCNCHHLWKFRSPVNFEEEKFPLEWTVSDINHYLHDSCSHDH